MSQSSSTTATNTGRSKTTIVSESKHVMRSWGSKGDEWDDVKFDFKLYLRKMWKGTGNENDLDIIAFLTGKTKRGTVYDASSVDGDIVEKADDDIYYGLAVSAERGSTAKMNIQNAAEDGAAVSIPVGKGRDLFQHLDRMYGKTGKSTTNLLGVFKNFIVMKMNKNETCEDWISRVDQQVTILKRKGELISKTVWAYVLTNGLPDQFVETKSGVDHEKPGYDTVNDIKEKLLSERNVLLYQGVKEWTWKNATSKGLGAIVKTQNVTCYHCGVEGHYSNKCPKSNLQWCSFCNNMVKHHPDQCFKNPNSLNFKGNNDAQNKGKGKKGKGKGKGKGKSNGKGNRYGNRADNYPSNYHSAFTAQDDNGKWERWVWSKDDSGETKKDETSSEKWTDKWTDSAGEYTFGNVAFTKAKQDFRLPLRDDLAMMADAQPSTHAEALPGGVQSLLQKKYEHIHKMMRRGDDRQFVYWDSCASHNITGEDSWLSTIMENVQPSAKDGVTVGNGASLPYVNEGTIGINIPVHTVKGMKFDLMSAFEAARRGVVMVLEFDDHGNNAPYTYDKTSKIVSPLVDRGSGVPELLLDDFLQHGSNALICQANPHEKMNELKRAFWSAWIDKDFDMQKKSKNRGILLYAFDILKQLSQREQEFLWHCRLAHTSRKAILQLIENGTTGIKFSGAFLELCRPCQQAKQKMNKKGKSKTRHPEGKAGEYLHSDLAIVNHHDIKGNNLALTIVDEVATESFICLLKNKTAETVLQACKHVAELLKARYGYKFKIWQFDRGTEFDNKMFKEWIEKDIGAKQQFSNIEHSWENGIAKRSFGVLFEKARAMLKHSDLRAPRHGPRIPC